MRTERRPARARLLLLVAPIGAAAAVWLWSPAPMPAPSGSTAVARELADAGTRIGAVDVAELPAAGETAAATPGARAGPREPPARSEVPPPRTAVVVTALDPGGAPLAGFAVLLQRTDKMSLAALRPSPTAAAQLPLEERSTNHASVVGTIDATGVFAFESLAAGNYKCHIVGLEAYDVRFELAQGEVRELMLRSPLVALTGTLYRAGAVAKDCFAVFEDGATRRGAPWPNGVDGTIRSFVAPGRYDVFVHACQRLHREPGWGPCLSRHVLLVPEGVGALRWRFETGGTVLTVRLHDASGKPVEVFTIEVEGTAACDQRTARYFAASERGRGAVVPALPDGQWRVAVNGANLIVAPRDLTTDDALPRHEMTFVAAAAATVTLVLRTRDGAAFSPPLSLLPPLCAVGRDLRCVAATSRASAAVGTGGFRVDYPNVPLGAAELRFEDRVEGDQQVMLPFEPVGRVPVAVAADGPNEIVLTVEPRVPVDLRGCDRSGIEEPNTVVTVWCDGRSVRSEETGPSQRWHGWLPRGTYRVVIDRGGVRREHSLRVDGEPVRQRYRP